MRPAPKSLSLVLTGSVAAVKTFLLADALRARGFAVRFAVTEAAWPFLKTEGKYAATAGQLESLRREALSLHCHPERSEGSPFMPPAREILRFAQDDMILVAPASADFIRQIARGDTAAGKEIRDSGKPVFVAPAMNVMMWRHPAVQDNVKRLLDAGMTVLGPACGDMACGDNGFGRMAEPAEIAAAVAARGDHPLAGFVKNALLEKPALPSRTRGPCRKILLVLQESSGDTVAQARRWTQDGCDVQCVAAPGIAGLAELAEITARPVVTEHYQIYPKDGMEHIWLPEDADVVVMYPASSAGAAEMAKGAAESFIGCIYLATKRPVVVVPGAGCAAADLAALATHGATVTDGAGLASAIKNLDQDEHSGFEGKSFLVLGGNARETVDSFRLYANTARDESHGARVAGELRARGAEVMFLSASGSAADILAQCRALKGRNFEAVIQLAGISQLTCSVPAAHKISKTGQERARLFQVAGNIDFMAELQGVFGAAKVMGYDNFQQWAGGAETPLRHKIVSLARRSLSSPSPPASLPPASAGGERMLRVIVTTGRTEEKITKDGVVITNGFTGRQGQEIARVFAAGGAEVILISGPTALPDLDRVRTVHAVSMREMHDAVMREMEMSADVFIGVAAVADFSLPAPLDLRLKPGAAFTLDMAENPSIVGEVARHKNRPKIVVSFAAQSAETVVEYALEKFEKLGVDLTVANPIGAGRDPEKNEICLIYRRDGRIVTEKREEMPKAETAFVIMDKILKLLPS